MAFLYVKEKNILRDNKDISYINLGKYVTTDRQTDRQTSFQRFINPLKHTENFYFNSPNSFASNGKKNG